MNTCADDASNGSLRAQIAVANGGDTIDLSTAQLACSTITLSQGQIAFASSITLVGPADRSVTITTATADRLLYQSGSGNLAIENLTLSGGFVASYSGDAVGGCVATHGSVYLANSVISGCSAYTHSGSVARGGSIYAHYVRLDTSRIVGNSVYNVTNAADGGGVFAPVGFNAIDSTISANSAIARGAQPGRGGGVYSGTEIRLTRSTIDSNVAQKGGGIHHTSPSLLSINYMRESTASGNVAVQSVGAVFCRCGSFSVYSSTIAFNSATTYAGLYASSAFLHTSSSIIARNRNTSASGFADVMLAGSSSWTGEKNLVMSYNLVPAANVVTVTADPRLAPLAFHGGPTRTHALLATSPAIDAGANPNAFSADQRGGTFAREVPTGAPDIGAYERQSGDDEIFYGGFD